MMLKEIYEQILKTLMKLKNPKTNWKYILIVVILGFFAGGGILIYSKLVTKNLFFLTQFPEVKRIGKETKNEQPKSKYEYAEEMSSKYEEIPYKNDKFGFVFQYPKTYAEDNCGQIKEGENSIFVGASIEIGIFNSDNLTLNEFVEREISQNEFDVESVENLVIGNEKAIKITFYFGKSYYGEGVFIKKYDRIYSLYQIDRGECPVAYEKGPPEWVVFYRILQTFKFR